MRTLKLIRFETSEEGTFGRLYDESEEQMFFTAELPKYAGDPDQLNERRIDCIPRGTYECKIKNSEKFGKVYEITQVPNRSGILIHAGNYAGDTSKGFKSNVLGCVLLGKSFGVMGGQRAIGDSKIAIKEFMDEMEDEPFILEIEEEYA